MTNDNILDHPNFERQIELEEKMRSLGIKRFRDNIERAVEDDSYSATQTGTRLVVAAHNRMVKAIEDFIAEANSGRAGRKHTAIKYLQQLNDNDVVANLTGRCILDALVKSPLMSRIASHLGAMIEDEVNSRIFQAEMPRAYKKFHEKAKKETLARRQWSHLLFPARLLGVELVEWDDKERLLLGTKLIELFVEATGLVDCVLVSEDGGRTTSYKIEAKPETLAWIEEENKRLETLFPVFLPTIVPPKPWTSPFDGGYYSRVIRNLKMVKTHNRAYLRELAERDMDEVYEALNALQNTAWQVNTRVLEVMEHVYHTSSEIGGVPRSEKLSLPTRPHWFPKEGRMDRKDMTPEQLDEFLRWKAQASEIHVENARQIKLRAQFLRTIGVACWFPRGTEPVFPPRSEPPLSMVF